MLASNSRTPSCIHILLFMLHLCLICSCTPSGYMPAPDACLSAEEGWDAKVRPSVRDPDGCGPCLLEKEHDACQDSANPLRHRAFRGGGPPPRRGHSSVLYQTPRNSDYGGATIMIVFGGIDANNTYLNDVWVMCVAKCPAVEMVYTDGSIKDQYGMPLLIETCPKQRCRWQEKMMAQDWEEWSSFVDTARAKSLKGVVPVRPAGRAGHSAVLGIVRTPGGSERPVMTVFGGRSPNCTDFCRDLWQYSILDNEWFLVYGEWADRDLEHRKLYDYSLFNQAAPSPRHGHTAVTVGDDLYVWGGHANGSASACCGQARPCSLGQDDPWYTVADTDCPFLNDLWVTSLRGYEPFFSQLARDKHTQQSSTLAHGLSLRAVDGVRHGQASAGTASLTDTDSQAWWQVDLGAVHQVSNVTIFNSADPTHRQRLQNYYVLVSPQPFVSDRLQEVLEDPHVWKAHIMYPDTSSPVSAVVADTEAQYVRVQLASTDYLSLAEVEVWGHPRIEPWQHLYGLKRWTQLLPHRAGKLPPTPRAHATMTAIHGNKLLLSSGRTRESPFWLSDMFVIHLAEYGSMTREGVRWARLEPRAQKPYAKLPLARAQQASVYSPLCSVGHVREATSDPMPGVLPHRVYPGVLGETAWCQGQVVYYGGKTQAATDKAHRAHPHGFLGDLWLYNVSSNVLSELRYDTLKAHPPRRAEHSMVLHQDALVVYGGAAGPKDCAGGVCGDAWVLNISGPESCPEPCSAHGTCEFGFCLCDQGFLGPQCADKACPNSQCVHDYSNHIFDCRFCAGHGTCAANGTCVCDKGWRGEDCSILHCPGGCSGHGSCKLGGRCDCDPGFGGPDCFLAFCPGNCTEWSDGFDRGVRGDCEITRYPPCCGSEPACERSEDSPSPCISRATGNQVVPSHQVEAVCYCADAYAGADCGQEVADIVMADSKRRIRPS